VVTAQIYSAIYGGYDLVRDRPGVTLFTEADEPLTELPLNRLRAKWWKVIPHIACPAADVTVWIDGNMDVRIPDLAERCVAELGDDDMLFIRHPWRDDIYEEAVESLKMSKYRGMPLLEQVRSYRRSGHPKHWGLVHGGLLVRRNTPAVVDFDRTWWHEIVRWSVQDQLSLPPLLRRSDLRWHWWPVSPLDDVPGDAGWVSRHAGAHARPD